MKDIILKTLRQNMGFTDGERILVVQSVADDVGSFSERYERSGRVCGALLEAFDGLDVTLLEVSHTGQRNGAEPTESAFEFVSSGKWDVVFMPTAFSLTHTKFRKVLTDAGSRVASMPGFRLSFFSAQGPLDVDYEEISKRSDEVAAELSAVSTVRIIGPGTDLVAAIDHDNIHISTGLITEPGEYGNLPGAETFFPPLTANGTLTIPAGWGGPVALPCDVTFTIKDGRFVDAVGSDQDYIDSTVKPILFGGENYDVVAEIGIGTNHGLSKDSVSRFGWDILLAEKIFGTAHVANGNSFAMGGSNNVPVHVDWVVPDVDILFE